MHSFIRTLSVLVVLVLAATALLAAYPMPLYQSSVELVTH